MTDRREAGRVSIEPALPGDARFAALIDSSMDGVLFIDTHGRVRESNRAAQKMFGCTSEELLGRELGALLLRPDPEVIVRRETGEVELRAVRSDGIAFPVEVTMASFPVDGGDGVVAHLRDLGTRRRGPRGRPEIRDETDDTLKGLGLAFVEERDERNLIERMTEGAATLTGAQWAAFIAAAGGDSDDDTARYTYSALQRTDVGRLLPKLAPFAEQVGAGRDVVYVADARRHPDLRVIAGIRGSPVSLLAAPVRTRSGAHLGAILLGHERPGAFESREETLLAELAAHASVALESARLYHQLSRREEEARNAYRVAREAARRRDEFLAVLGHELRNPLAPIMTAVEVMRLKGDDPSTAPERAIIERQAKHLQRLVDDLLDLSRIMSGKLGMRRAPVDLAEVTDDAVEMVEHLIEQRGHAFEIDILDGVLWVLGDESRLAQALANLLSNAARYTDPGGRITFSTAREKDDIVIRIADSGIGIEPEMITRLFEPFAQADRPLDRADGGLGLGLTLVRHIIEMHGGTVVGRSDGLGRGSEFILRLPAIEPPPLRSGGRRRTRVSMTATPRPSVPQYPSLRVLLVDDNEDARELLAIGLRRRGFDVRVAADGPQALIVAVDFRPQVAVLDIGLPVMDGFELCRRLRSVPGLDVRIVALTGYGRAIDRERTSEAGFDAHLVKPVELDALATALVNGEPQA